MAVVIPRSLTELEGEKSLPPSFIREEDERSKVPYNQFSNEIPVISLAGIDGHRRHEIRRKIADACETWGIFQTVDHGVDAQLVSDMTRLAGKFFRLPKEEKLRFDRGEQQNGGFYVSSYFQGEPVQEWREVVSYFSYPLKSRDYSKWPDKPEGWRKVTEIYSEKLMSLGNKLMGLLSEAMGLETEALTKVCKDIDQRVVVNYYPKCPQPDLTLGLRRHTDPGTITLLLQDQVGGLQATRDNGKTWITVQPVPGAFVVNLGDHAYCASNGRFKSADHQVAVNSNSSRMSIAAFILPEKEALVYPMVTGEEEKPILQEPITFVELVKQKRFKYLEHVRLKKLAKQQNQHYDELKLEDKPFIEMFGNNNNRINE